MQRTPTHNPSTAFLQLPAAVLLTLFRALVLFPALFTWPATLHADFDNSTPVETELDGHLKFYSRVMHPPSGTVFDLIGDSPNVDGSVKARLNSALFLSNRISAKISWEGVFAGGGSRKDGQRLKQLYPAQYPDGLFSPLDDDRRLMDLTGILHDGNQTVSYHRLDRAVISFTPAWGEIRLGRQAVTWGHGFSFNPMDLVNPFSPEDLEREYKTGEDMFLTRFSLFETDLELIYVMHRDPANGQTGFDQSSLGVKARFTTGATEIEIMGTRHYKDLVTGIGAVGYIGDAAWRCDVTGTFLNESSRGQSAYASAVANIDYSWNWLDRNMYGFLELYFNGLSDNNTSDHFTDPAVARRIARGELFALGSLYASAHINIELHPLLNFYLTPIINLNDGSGTWLPRFVYDLSDNLRLTLSGVVNWGSDQTEYGGYSLPGTSYLNRPANSVSAWLAWYF